MNTMPFQPPSRIGSTPFYRTHVRCYPFVLILALTVFALQHAAAQNDDSGATFNTANEAYQSGDFEAAARAYESILETRESPEVRYNLGNAYYRLGQPGKAILNYKRALALSPGHPGAKTNLAFVREQARIPAEVGNPLKAFAGTLAVDAWALFATLGFWVAVGGIVVPSYIRNLRVGGSILAAAGALALIIGLAGLAGYHLKSSEAVVVIAEAPLRVSPTASEQAQAYVDEGAVVTIVDRFNDYFLVELPNGQSGWAQDSEVEKVWR